MSEAIRYDTTPLQSVTLSTTAKGQVSIEVRISDASADVAAEKAKAIFDRLREGYAATNDDIEYYRGVK